MFVQYKAVPMFMVQTANCSLFKTLTKEIQLLLIGLFASVGAEQHKQFALSFW